MFDRQPLTAPPPPLSLSQVGHTDYVTALTVTPDGRLPEADKGNPFATAAGLRVRCDHLQPTLFITICFITLCF